MTTTTTTTTTTTRRQIIEKMYNDFQTEIKENLGETIFPNLDEIDLAEVLIIFNTIFAYIKDYKCVVKDLIEKKMQISDEEYEKVFPIIETFINEFKRIQI